MGQRLDPRSLGVSCVCMILAMHVLRRTIHLSLCSRLMRECHNGYKTYWNFLIPKAEPFEYLLILIYGAWYDSHPVESKMVEDSIRICSLLALLDNSYQQHGLIFYLLHLKVLHPRLIRVQKKEKSNSGRRFNSSRSSASKRNIWKSIKLNYSWSSVFFESHSSKTPFTNCLQRRLLANGQLIS
jgi:hypothetical protein